MDEPDINFYLLGSEDAIIELNSSSAETLLDKMMSKLYQNDELYKTGQSDRAVIAKWKTNVRYQISDVPAVPIFGYKQVDFSGPDPFVVLFSKRYSDPESFYYDFSSIIWVTYRYGFDPIVYKDRVFTSDTGWGCTIRVGQMLLLNTLKIHFKPKSCLSFLELIQENLTTAPFSLHKIVECGQEYEKYPGDWYSPSLIAHVLQNLSEKFPIPNLKIIVFMDSIVYKNQIPTKQSVLILIPLMLGIGCIQEEYYDTLKFFLSLQWSVGIIGGIPKSALYVVGYQDNSLLFLDPHLVQPACTSGQDLINKLLTYQCTSPKLLPIPNAESSITVGFYFCNFEDFKLFESKIQENSERLYGLITFKEDSDSNDTQKSESEEEYYLV